MVNQSSWISDNVLVNYPRDYTNDLLTGSRRLNLQAPMSLDIKIHKALHMDELRGDKWPKYTLNYDNANPSFQNFINFPLRKYYSRCFVDVISETRYAQQTANISEKFLQAVMFRTPFIMVAPPILWNIFVTWVIKHSQTSGTNHMTLRLIMPADCTDYILCLRAWTDALLKISD